MQNYPIKTARYCMIQWICKIKCKSIFALEIWQTSCQFNLHKIWSNAPVLFSSACRPIQSASSCGTKFDLHKLDCQSDAAISTVNKTSHVGKQLCRQPVVVMCP